MKNLYYTGLIGLALFEIMNVYFIMPMPGSQQRNAIYFAYFLYTWRWVFRIVFGLMILLGSIWAFRATRKWIAAVALIVVVVIAYMFNFRMSADHMFLQPANLVFKSRAENTLGDSSIVVAVSVKGDSKAYPIRFIQYHHQVRDSIGGKAIMVTYCNVCRTGRVFEPVVNGKAENFRLVGMDHFNALFEDTSTKSWWRQATGEAITGPLKGSVLTEVDSYQLTLNKFFSTYPFGKVMQAELASEEHYDTLGKFERGKSTGKLTRTDSTSWQKKSWVLGIVSEGKSKAYDWIELKKLGILNDEISGTPLVILISADGHSFAAFKRPGDEAFKLENDSLVSAQNKFGFDGRAKDGTSLPRVNVYQEFWHSWKQFHPGTAVYP